MHEQTVHETVEAGGLSRKPGGARPERAGGDPAVEFHDAGPHADRHQIQSLEQRILVQGEPGGTGRLDGGEGRGGGLDGPPQGASSPLAGEGAQPLAEHETGGDTHAAPTRVQAKSSEEAGRRAMIDDVLLRGSSASG